MGQRIHVIFMFLNPLTFERSIVIGGKHDRLIPVGTRVTPKPPVCSVGKVAGFNYLVNHMCAPFRWDSERIPAHPHIWTRPPLEADDTEDTGGRRPRIGRDNSSSTLVECSSLCVTYYMAGEGPSFFYILQSLGRVQNYSLNIKIRPVIGKTGKYSRRNVKLA